MYLHQINTNRMPGPGDLCDGPEDDGGEYIDQQTALDMAAEEALATPYTWSYFLNEVVEKTEPVETCIRKSSDWFAGDATVDALLAIVMNCGDWDIVREARCELRDRLLAYSATKHQIEDRAKELVDEASPEHDDDPYRDDPHHWY